MTTAAPRTSSAKTDMPSPPSPILPSTCASATSKHRVRANIGGNEERADADTTIDTPNLARHIELDIDIGADAKDWNAIQSTEKLKPVEAELRRIEELVGEIVSEMEYLRSREQKLRDTNESTNERVKWFAFGTMGMLVGLGAWQVVYLRAYFRCAHPTTQFSRARLTGKLGRSILSRAKHEIMLVYEAFWAVGIVPSGFQASNLCTCFASSFRCLQKSCRLSERGSGSNPQL